mmetsp:Transcript_12957/g.31426  ORF Transcript_12957/g.31426 Transcript_12957/m.31426 type:complete len:251 (-) Transcript_12957:115-867(-)
MVCAPASATISCVEYPADANCARVSAPDSVSAGIRFSGSAPSASTRPKDTSIFGPPVSSTAYAPAAAMTSANESPAAGPARVASYTLVTGPRPRLRPKLSGRVSSNLTEPFIPPSPVACLYVPESWNTSLSTAGALVCTMFSTSAARSASRACGVSTPAGADATAWAISTSKAVTVVAANKPVAASVKTPRRVRVEGRVRFEGVASAAPTAPSLSASASKATSRGMPLDAFLAKHDGDVMRRWDGDEDSR